MSYLLWNHICAFGGHISDFPKWTPPISNIGATQSILVSISRFLESPRLMRLSSMFKGKCFDGISNIFLLNYSLKMC
jgi:hypothetical protein